MPQTDFQKSFEKAVDEFLAPALAQIKNCSPVCQVIWVHPNGWEHNQDFSLGLNLSLELKEAEHYVRSFVGEGFCALVRLVSFQDEIQLQIVLWEEWNGEFKQAYRPSHNGKLIEDWVWEGFSVKGANSKRPWWKIWG